MSLYELSNMPILSTFLVWVKQHAPPSNFLVWLKQPGFVLITAVYIESEALKQILEKSYVLHSNVWVNQNTW